MLNKKKSQITHAVVASDMDGTLLGPDHKLSSYAKETLTLLTHKGVHFIFATGRHHIDIAQIRQGLGINAFMITSNGARIHDADNGLIFSRNLDLDIVYDLCQMVYDHRGIETHAYKDDGWYTNRDCDDVDAFFQESVFNYRLFDAGKLDPNGVGKIFFTAENPALLIPMEGAINALWGNRVNVSFSTANCLEVMSGGVSKGCALEFVSALLGRTLNDCIAFGDGMNDVEMLRMVDKGCIMMNAPQRLKDALPELEVIGANKDDAVAKYLRQLYQV